MSGLSICNCLFMFITLEAVCFSFRLLIVVPQSKGQTNRQIL
uniref:Uncharacterized protein n=1 Tax=Arundo donax TaxID=35708 RepID=A0A0A9SYU8_ARUDO